jgi:hypothetical protein
MLVFILIFFSPLLAASRERNQWECFISHFISSGLTHFSYFFSFTFTRMLHFIIYSRRNLQPARELSQHLPCYAEETS